MEATLQYDVVGKRGLLEVEHHLAVVDAVEGQPPLFEGLEEKLLFDSNARAENANLHGQPFLRVARFDPPVRREEFLGAWCAPRNSMTSVGPSWTRGITARPDVRESAAYCANGLPIGPTSE